MPRSGVGVQGSSNNSRGRLLQPFDYTFVLNALPYILSFITVICEYHSIQHSVAFYSLVTAGQENIFRHCEENISQELPWQSRSS
jgi:hypothetical protein